MILFVLVWAIGLNWIAYKRGFYHSPELSTKSFPLITTGQIIALFGLYVGIMMVLSIFLVTKTMSILQGFDPTLTSLPISFLTGIQFFLMLVVFLVLTTTLAQVNQPAFSKVWKDRQKQERSCLFDFFLGVMTWFLSFPIVSIVSELVEKLLQSIVGLKYYEQTAVKFVKAAMGSPLSLVFAVLSVLVMAPLIEEFLFRGGLQTYFKKRLGAKPAILLSSLCFALFHFSPRQGLGNIPLILSLLILGGFLGFIYERQGSLWAPIGLHMTFNTISACRIILLPEF